MIYVIGYPGTSGKAIVEEMGIYDEVRFIDEVWNTESKWFNKFNSWYRQRENRVYIKALKRIIEKGRISVVRDWYYSHINLTNVKFETGEDNYIVMICSGLVMGYSNRYLQYIKEKYNNVHMILYMYDPMDIFFDSVCKEKEVLKHFDVIYNINKEEAVRFGQKYYPLILSKKELMKTYTNNDIFFCASGTDRCMLLEKIYTGAREHSVTSKFIMYYQWDGSYEGVEKREKFVDYEDYLSMVNESNCLLELLHHSYENPTQRYPEAVLYNKKLLTNNEKIKEFPYYNEKYMKIFHDVSEIDWEWIKRKEEVDYGYGGEFSPACFLKEAMKEFNVSLKGKRVSLRL